MRPRIVVPVEETPRSERALPVAAALARRMETSLVLVTVLEWPFAADPAHAGYHERLMESYPDLSAESVVIRSAEDTSKAIISACEPDDIVCMGADHTSVLGEILQRSVFFDMVRHSHHPVVAVGPHARIPEGATEFVLCVDGFEYAEHGLSLIRSVGAFAKLRPTLLQVVNPERGDSKGSGDDSEANYLRTLTSKEGVAKGLPWDILHGEPVTTISTFCSNLEVAAIGFATDALDPLVRLLSPSLANELIATSTRPVVLVASERRPNIERHLIPSSVATR